MIVLAVISFSTFLCVWESLVFCERKEPEDIIIAVVTGGVAMFLLAMKLKGVFT